jgi:hypothetical protein
MPLPRALSLLIAVLAGLSAAFAAETPSQSAGPKSSPFMPPAVATPVSAEAEPGEILEFAGISSVGSRTDFIVHDRSAKKSFWIGMGETKNGIALVSHDPKRDILTITSNGVQKQLPLRKGVAGSARTTAAPSPVINNVNQYPANISNPQLPPPPALPSSPPQDSLPVAAESRPTPASPAQEAILKQETEARNLVSDLLEIGMAQRRAYEEAQRRNAGSIPAEIPPGTPKQP